jgi:hypothetical protein
LIHRIKPFSDSLGRLNTVPNYTPDFEIWWETQAPGFTSVTGVLANAFKEVAFRGWTAHKDAIRPVVYALLDILDGVPTHDIQNMTGLPPARCDAIMALYDRLYNGHKTEWLKTFN